MSYLVKLVITNKQQTQPTKRQRTAPVGEQKPQPTNRFLSEETTKAHVHAQKYAVVSCAFPSALVLHGVRVPLYALIIMHALCVFWFAAASRSPKSLTVAIAMLGTN